MNYNINCDFCNKNFTRNSRDFKTNIRNKTKHFFCSCSCRNNFRSKKLHVECKNCFKRFKKIPSQISKNNFCTKSCAAKYNNVHKISGTRVSKLEIWIREKLQKNYPNLEMHFNRKDAINSELDIYIPSLSFAVELNGIFHYEPIYGKDKLESIQNNDSRKYQACLEKQIELCIIDTCQMKNFKEQKAMFYFNIIKSIIDSKL